MGDADGLPPLKSNGRDWRNYEVLLPRPSHSVVGRANDCKFSTIPYVRTVLRSEAYERTVSRTKQQNLNSELARPKVVNQPPPAQKDPLLPARQLPSYEERLAAAGPPLPQPRRRSDRGRASDPRNFSGREGFSDRYSETPMHERKAASKVFDLPEYVARERAIITSGRHFTWGGRLRLQLPSFDPLRDRMLVAHPS